MPVDHMVWFKFKPEVSEQRIAEHLKNLESLRDLVPGILALHTGKNFTDRAQGFTHGLLVTFASKETLRAYAEHPQHVAVATSIRRDADVIAMDFEFAAACGGSSHGAH